MTDFYDFYIQELKSELEYCKTRLSKDNHLLALEMREEKFLDEQQRINLAIRCNCLENLINILIKSIEYDKRKNFMNKLFSGGDLFEK